MHRGFTLIEAIISTALIAVLMIIITEFYIQGNRLQLQLNNQMTTLTAARTASHKMVKAIREMTTGANGGYALIAATNTSLDFYADIDNDQIIEEVQYFLNGTTLQQRITKPSGNPTEYQTSTGIVTTLATNVANGNDPIFIFYTPDYPTNSTPLPIPIDLKNVALIKIQLAIGSGTTVNSTNVIETFAHLRNLKTNL
jgi:prepilin-type N-terminal cleavage/methylation domain-containing protein